MTSYLETNLELIIMNSHGLKNNESLKIPGYRVYKVNTSESLSDGSAIVIKHDIFLNLIDDL